MIVRRIAWLVSLAAVLIMVGCYEMVVDRVARWHLTENRFETRIKNKLTYDQIVDLYGRPVKVIQGGDVFIGLWRSPYKFLSMEVPGGRDLKCWCGHWEYRFTFLKATKRVVGFRRDEIKKRFCRRYRHQKDPCAGCCERR